MAIPLGQWLFLVPLTGGRSHIIPPIGSIYHLYTTYILPSGGLYATYHLLGEPETTIDSGFMNDLNLTCTSYFPIGWFKYQLNHTGFQEMVFPSPDGAEPYRVPKEGPKVRVNKKCSPAVTHFQNGLGKKVVSNSSFNFASWRYQCF